MTRFEVGDFLEVRAKEGNDDYGVVRGAALDSRGFTGYPHFRIKLANGEVIRFNLNYDDDVTVLFRADVARAYSKGELE